ncbi:hypothetical protein EI94DRAFT_1740424 [Lactarius quietus]|nr:hypothetical protein EI94DRAFT_1740424 [Lactarius quietus]
MRILGFSDCICPTLFVLRFFLTALTLLDFCYCFRFLLNRFDLCVRLRDGLPWPLPCCALISDQSLRPPLCLLFLQCINRTTAFVRRNHCKR